MKFKYSEEDRLDALKKLKLIYTDENENFDRITRLASQHFNTPISLISLIDSESQWFKSKVGVDNHQIPIEDSFCRFTIQTDEGLIVNDASMDTRFRHNKLVKVEDGIRFYAGIPLITSDGFAVGTICVIDRVPRSFSEADKEILQDLASIVMSQIDSVVYVQKAEESSKLKSEFLATISHEIRTPMNGVIAMSKRLLETQLSERQHFYAETVEYSAYALLHIIDDILDFSKIETGKMELNAIPFNLYEMCSQSIDSLLKKAQEKELNLSINYLDTVCRYVIGDPDRLRQSVINLVGNAIKFTDSGSIVVSVTTDQTSDDSVNLQISISDTGIGIGSEKLKHLFEKFTQVDASASRRHGGIGLGLAITKQLVELMGGKIIVNSVEGKGSVFTFSVPLLLQKANNLLVSNEVLDEKDRWRNNPTSKDVRVLLAEDNRINQEVMISIMENYSIALEVSPNGLSAFEARCKNDFDLVLMDCQMPVMDGYKATQMIREFENEHKIPKVPIVAVTANVMKGDREHCIEAGMDDYLSKPVIESELAHVLWKWLPQDESRRNGAYRNTGESEGNDITKKID